jgi:hypothetical protein
MVLRTIDGIIREGNKMKHALVIGGTGMLANVSLWLINEGYHVSVIGRNSKRMNKLISLSKDETFITPILVDYNHDYELREQLDISVKKNGQIDIVIAWIHTIGKNVLKNVITEDFSGLNHPWRLLHVLGSDSNLVDVKGHVTMETNCLYRQVQLGFVIEGETSRWLTNEEISNGVIESIKKDKLVNLVGVLEPAIKRPR